MNKKIFFGKISDNSDTFLYEIRGSKGMTAQITDFGASLVSLTIPLKKNVGQKSVGTGDFSDTTQSLDIVLGYEKASDYENGGCYFGATIGRNSNRIANSQFELDGVIFRLNPNNNENNLHGGPKGFSECLWQVDKHSTSSIKFLYNSPDMEEGFPGNAKVSVEYTISDENELIISYAGISDKKTIFNLTNHSYFNLNGAGNGNILKHSLQINADAYNPVIDGKAIPTGEIAPVLGTPFNFTVAKEIGTDFYSDNSQLKYVKGYDHNFVLGTKELSFDMEAQSNDKLYSYKDKPLFPAAALTGDISGIRMEIYTDCPGLQLYTSNFVEHEKGKLGNIYGLQSGLALETQFFPDAINQPSFKAPVYEANTAYSSTTIYKFLL